MKLFGIDVGHGNSLKDKLYWLINGFMTNMGFVLWGGSPPPAAPTSTTVNQTNIPDYAQPYVMNMLNAAQAQIYNPSGTGFNPYIPYSNNPANYVAGPSPMQQQAYTNVANMQVPGQYGMATGQTLGASRQLGGLGQQMGMAGQNYANQATKPASVNAYMNPYIQASLAPQLQLANQQYGIAGQQEQSGATQAGAFGGSREALMNSLNQQNQMLAQNQLISQGYNNAFNQAQQAQQFGANLGLQGQQGQLAALQGQLGAANQLGSLGGAQLAAQQGIANQQNTFGQQQQTQQQNAINQAVQNYATAQQYPFMQLGLLNSMLRGLPMQQSSTQMYQAPPNPLTQLAGLGATAYGLSKKDGGVIKAAGGLPMSMMSDQQLDGIKKSPSSSTIAKIIADGDIRNHAYLESNPQAKQVFAQPLPMPQTPMPNPQQMAMAPQNRTGLGAVGTGNMVPPVGAAGGGLLAFVGGGDTATDGTLVPPPGSDQSTTDQFSMANIPRDKKGDTDWDTAIAQKLFSPQKESPAVKAQREALETGIAERAKQMDTDKWTHLGLNLLAQTGPFAGVNLGQAGMETLDWMSKQQGLADADRKDLLKMAVEEDRAREGREDRLMGTAAQIQGNKQIKAVQMAGVNAQIQATKDARLATDQLSASKLWQDSITKNAMSIRANAAKLGTDIDEPTVQREAYKMTYDALKPTPAFQYLTDVTAPEEAAPVTATPPAPETHWYTGLGDKISNALGGSKEVNFNQLPKQ